MAWLQEEVENAIENVIEDFTDALLGLINNIYEAILGPIVGVPTPKSDSGYMVVGAPDNAPWESLYQDVYLSYIMPLAIMMSVIAFAFVGLRAGSMSEYRRKQLLRRLGLVFMGTFVWFPLVSIPLQFIDAVGLTIAPTDEMSAGLGGLIQSSLGGTFAVLAMVVISNFFLVVAGFIVALRWISLCVLTPIMPLLGVLWSMEVWPFSPAANMARRAAGIYPGLVLAGIPPAILFRIGWEVGGLETSVKGLFSLFIGLALIPAAIIAMLMTVYWSSPAMRTIAQKGVSATNPGAAASGAAKAKRASGKTVRGARNVHRGYADNKIGAVTKSGQTTIGSSGSKAYKVGASARSTKTHAGRYNNLRKSKTGRMRDKATDDARKATQKVSTRTKRGLKNTKRKVSRW
ncbi:MULTISPECIES: hypothetical protein [Natrialba]|uniref:Uncharacterized protein n=2 Tax=Natrialba TaxID=63742 RepID=M0AMV5_9EURY|nr:MULTISPECIES: hypothetical protein [Natrialba]ELY93114.1 hypothetical protein C484_07863 [Natrialba taiwanensis DSM 12281]ELY99869.1 hypothetical protein C480_19724 [Natrialba aegyptia DSM 13077]